VRFAAELHDLLVADLPGSYLELAPKVRITILEAGREVLGTYEAGLRAYADRKFRRAAVSVRTNSPVGEVLAGGRRQRSGELVPAGLVLWDAAPAPTAIVAGLPFARDAAGRLVMDDSLQIPGGPGVFALGDCACPEGRALPQLTQVAEQQGRYLAVALNRRAAGPPCDPFVWRPAPMGSFLGGGRAIVEGRGRRPRRAGW
jgi:NADH dehydrogenase FAD-containing subunit